MQVKKKNKKKHKMTMVRQRNESIPSRDIDDQRILESHSSHGASGHTKP